ELVGQLAWEWPGQVGVVVEVEDRRRTGQQTAAADDDALAALALDFEPAAAAQAVESSLTGEGTHEGGGAVARVGRLLEALGLGQRPHAGDQRLEQRRGVDRERLDDALDDCRVLALADLTRARAGGHAELRGGAGSRAWDLADSARAAAQGDVRLDRLGHLARGAR